MLRISLSRLNELYEALNSVYPLYLPVKKADKVDFGKYESGVETSLLTLKTNKSAKDFFFPQSEDLMKFKVDGQKIEIIKLENEADPFVVMGVKACDYKAFEVLDNVFLVDPIDTYYKTKRDAGIIITLACTKPEGTCFCTAFNIDPTHPLGDVTTWNDEQYLYWEANTSKGKDLTAKVASLFEDTDSKAVGAIKANTAAIMEKLPYTHLDVSVLRTGKTLETFADPRWAKLSEACLGCGSCTFVCPTCQCFDIREFNTKSGVKRFRCWDSCMYKDFTKTAGGQPRPTQTQRFRQRFMHKLNYYPENNNGLYSCVGCGRCIKRCPQHLNIVKVIKAFGGDSND